MRILSAYKTALIQLKGDMMDKAKDKKKDRQAELRERNATRKVREQEIEKIQSMIRKREAYKVSLDDKTIIYLLEKPDVTTKWSNVRVLMKWSWYLSPCSHYFYPYSFTYFLEGKRMLMVNFDHIVSIEHVEIDFADDFIPEISYEDICKAI